VGIPRMQTVEIPSDKAPGLWYVEDATGRAGEYHNCKEGI